MSWQYNEGTDSDVVLSTRVRLARNIASLKFVNKLNIEEKQEIIELFRKNINKFSKYNLSLIEMDSIDEITKKSMVEKNLISPNFLKCENGAVLLNNDESICIMVNEEEHISIQCFESGNDINKAYLLANEIDDLIGSIVKYAYNKEFGYLTICPTNIGTGFRYSVMLHLPALKMIGKLNRVLAAINSLNINVRGIQGEGSICVGDMYQISNKITIGISENEIIKNMQDIIQKLIDQERKARKILLKNKLQLEDKFNRVYGIISNAKLLSFSELNTYISDIRMGIYMELIDTINIKQLNKILIDTKTWILQKNAGKQLNELETDIQRTIVIKKIIESRGE